MFQHVRNGGAVCADKGNIKIGCRPEYDVSPSLANLRRFIPPPSAVPSLLSPDETIVVIVIVFA